MSIYRLEHTQMIPAPLEEVWEFFSKPDNLAIITPPYMKFRTTSPLHDGDIYAGQVITYKVSPLLSIPLSWMTEITHVKPLKMFVDEQRHGPYAIWHHQHMFEDKGTEVLMRDIVHYKLPLGWLGRLANSFFVRRQLDEIFEFRKTAVEKRFLPRK